MAHLEIFCNITFIFFYNISILGPLTTTFKEQMMAATSSIISEKPFELALSQLGKRDVILFPLLRQIHTLPNLPDALKRLTFPELLLGNYEEKTLERSHPIFATLNELIEALKHHQELSPILRELRTIYKKSIRELCSTHNKKRWKLFRGPVRIFTLLNGSPTCFILTQKRGRELLFGGATDSTLFGSISIFCEHKLEIEPPKNVDFLRLLSMGKTFLAPLPLLFLDNLVKERRRAHLIYASIQPLAGVIQEFFTSICGDLKETRRSDYPLVEIKKWLCLQLGTLSPDERALLLELICSAIPDLLTSLDVALRNGDETNARLILFGEVRVRALQTSSFSTSSSQSSERALQERFIHAFQEGDLEEQVFSLVKQAYTRLGDERPNYWEATLLLNSASLIAQKVSSRCEDCIIGQLEQVERRFIQDEIGRFIRYEGRIKEYRSRLKRAREEATCSLERHSPIDHILLELAQGYKEILSDLLSESTAIKGAPPTQFAMVGLGSMSRNELCPYSDIEFLFLLEEDNEENRAYFRSIARLITLRIANFGETEHEIPIALEGGNASSESITPSGFKMDSGLSPLGQKGLYEEGAYELIGSPEKLAQFHLDKSKDIILLNAMTTSCLITGRGELLDRYQGEVSAILDGLDLGVALKRRQIRALELMQQDIKEFNPELNEEKIQMGLFGVKKELYRLPQSTISNLALYHGIAVRGTFRRIDQLREKRIISTTGSMNLKKTIRTILELRVKTHLFYKKEHEILYQKDEGQNNYLITPEIRQDLIEIYRTLTPLREKVILFLNGDERAFSNSPFYDQTVGSFDSNADRELRFESALQSTTATAALDPNNPITRFNLAQAQKDLGQIQKAITNLNESLLSLEKEGKERAHLQIAITLQALGSGYYSLGNYLRSIEYSERSLTMFQEFYHNEPHPHIANTLMNLGASYNELGDRHKAIHYYELSLAILKQVYGDQPNSSVAMVLNNIATSYQGLSNYEKAIEQNQTALQMRVELEGGRPNPDIAMSLNNFASMYHHFEQYEKAVEQYNASLSMFKEIYGDRPHPAIAESLNNLGDLYQEWGDDHQATSYYQSSIEVSDKIFGDQPNPNKARSLEGLGIIDSIAMRYDEAIERYTSSLKMKRELYPEVHLEISDTLTNLGNAHKGRANYSLAIEYYESSLAIKRKVYGERVTPEIANNLSNLGNVYSDLKLYSKAIEYYESSLEIYKKNQDGQSSLAYARCMNNLGNVYNSLGAYSKAIEYFSSALSIKRQTYSDHPHLEIASSLGNLASAHNANGEHLKAIELFQEAHDIYLKKLGPEHSNTKLINRALQDATRRAIMFGRRGIIFR